MSDDANPIQNVRWTGPEDKTVVVEAAGDIDLQRSAVFQETLLTLLGEGAERMVVDLSGVEYMDSSGVASLVKLLARVRRDGIALRLAGLNPRVRSVFEITRLDTVFEIFANQQEALDS